MLGFLLFLGIVFLHSKVKVFFLKKFNQLIFWKFFVQMDAMMSLAFWVIFIVFNFHLVLINDKNYQVLISS